MMKITKLIIALITAFFICPAAVYAADKIERIDAAANINGQAEVYSLYSINDYCYIKPCDLAAVLDNTAYQFNIKYDSDDAIHLIKGAGYRASGNDDPMTVGFGDRIEAEKASMNVTVGKSSVELEGYIIDGAFYVKVRDIAEVLSYIPNWREFGSYIAFTHTDSDEMAILNLIPALKLTERTVTATVQETKLSDEITTVAETTTEATTLQRVDPSKPMIALTFDDGPRAGSTDKIVEALKSVDGRATFFVVGNQVKKNPQLVKMAVDAGCQIGNHSNTHANLNKLSSYSVKTEINTCSNLVYEAAGVYPMIGRPPYGSINDTVRAAANIPWFNWNYDTLDWKNQNADYVYNTVVNNARDGQVMLLHDLHLTTAEGIVKAIPKLNEMGYQLVTIDEMAQAKGGYDKVPGYIK